MGSRKWGNAEMKKWKWGHEEMGSVTFFRFNPRKWGQSPFLGLTLRGNEEMGSVTFFRSNLMQRKGG